MADETVEQIDAQIAEVGAELETLNAKAEALTADEPGTDLVPVAKTAVDARKALAHQRASAIKMRQELATAAKRMSELQRRKVAMMERAMRRELERMERQLGPLAEQLEKLEEAVWTVNLYLGRDEEIVRLYNGKAAPASTPVIVRQLVLAMDQECAVAAEDGGIDSLNHTEFDKWLKADWAHVEQVIPEEKCVVAVVPRYDNKRYEDAGTYDAAAKGNGQTYFLIRNGKQVYRTWTDFRIGRSLVPKRDEFTEYFMRRGEPMEPGSREWMDAEKSASYKQRQYMRVGLILEGLLHRTTVFHPLPDEGISFTDPQFHEKGTVRFVLDAERTLGTGREPFKQWLKRLNAQLRPGMRIVANFRSQGFYEAMRDSDDGGKRRIRGAGGGYPDSGAIYRIEAREPSGALIIRFHPEGTRLVEDGVTPVPGKPGYVYRYKQSGYKRRKSALLFPDDDFLIPYDLVTVEECQAYLDSRVERASYVTMFPVLKAVMKAKRAEEALEAPFRTMLTGVLARDCKVPVAQAEADVPELVRWYKLSNRIHRPIAINGQALPPGVDWDEVDLVSQDPHAEDSAKPIRLITAEYKLRLRAAERGHSDEMVDTLKAKHPDALVIARLRSGPYVVLTPEDDRNVHVHERQYYARSGELKEEKRWVLPGNRAARWLMLYESKRWAKWDLAATAAEHLTGPELDELLERVKAKHKPELLLAVCTRTGHDDDYGWTSKLPGNLFAEAWIIEEHNSAAIGGTEKVSRVARTYRWERKGRGKPQLLKGQDHTYSYGREAEGRPWAHSDAHGRKRTRLYYENEEGAQAFKAEQRRHAAESKRQSAKDRKRQAIVSNALRSIEVQWLQPRYDKVWQRFLDDYADPTLWEGHRKQHHDLLPRFTLHHSANRGGRRDAPAWVRALHALAEAGHEPWGMTVDEALQLAHKDPRFEMTYDDWEDDLIIWGPESPGGSRSSVGHRKPEEVELSAPEEIAGLVYTKGLELNEPWPDPDAEDDDLGLPSEFCEECGEYLDECECAVLGEDFDAETDAEEGVAALPAGEVVDAEVVEG